MIYLIKIWPDSVLEAEAFDNLIDAHAKSYLRNSDLPADADWWVNDSGIDMVVSAPSREEPKIKHLNRENMPDFWVHLYDYPVSKNPYYEAGVGWTDIKKAESWIAAEASDCEYDGGRPNDYLGTLIYTKGKISKEDWHT